MSEKNKNLIFFLIIVFAAVFICIDKPLNSIDDPASLIKKEKPLVLIETASAASTLAPTPTPAISPTTIKFGKNTSISSFGELTASITNWLLSIASFLAIFFLIIGGLYYITALGDTRQMEEAKKIITYVVIGLIVILISYTLVLTLNKIIFG